jgi:PAS domain S-box-containing protein
MNRKIIESRFFLLIVSFIMLFLGGLYVLQTWNNDLQTISSQALKVAQTAEAAFPKDIMSKLNVDSTDLEKPEYLYLKTSLMSIAKVDKDIRFAYIYVKKGDKLYFAADSESPASKDYSPPGQELTAADPQDFKPFIDGQPLITTPLTDQWGRWVSVLVPIKNIDTNEVTGIFGVDYPADNWDKVAVFHTLQIGLIVLLLFILAINILVIINNNLKIRDAEKNYHSFFEAIEDIVVIGDKNGKIIYCNAVTVRKLGFTQKELLSKKMLDLNPKNKQKEAEQVFSDMLSGKLDYFPLSLERKSGTLLPVEIRVWAGKWNGQDCIFEVSKDLSIEQEALQKFNKIFDSNPNLMAVSSISEGKLTDVNKAFCDKLGYSKDELIGKTSQELKLFVQPEKQALVFTELKKNGSVQDIELQIKTRSGRVLDGIFSGEVIDIHGKNYYLTVMVDQTERKIINDKLQNIIAGANAGTWEWDVQTGEMVLNERWAEIVGYSLDELKPISIKTWQDLMHPDDWVRSNELMQSHFRREVENYSFDCRMKHKNGSWVWVYSSGKVTEWDKEGKPIKMFGTNIDITETKMAAEEILKKNQDLERMNKLMVGRELKMKEMKEEIEKLKNK